MKKEICLSIVGLLLLCGCVATSQYVAEENLVVLNVSFTDARWDGSSVPVIGRCKKCSGDGFSPELIVSNIPDGTNAVVIEFNDRDFQPLAANGGHGTIWVAVAGQTEIVVPSIPEETYDLPGGVQMEKKHRAPVGKPGAYFGPCGCGRGNRYFAIVKAVKKSDQEGESRLLGEGIIELGRF